MHSFLQYIGSSSRDNNPNNLSKNAKKMIVTAFSNFTEITDMHTHLGGSESDVTGCCVHPNLNSILHPFSYGQQLVFKSAAGMTNQTGSDKQYLDTLISRTYNFSFCANENGIVPEYKHLLLALDKWYDSDGTERLDKTSMYIPNEYLMNVVRKYNDIFEACISINPYKSSALEELEHYAKLGVRVVKWLPNSMGIKMNDENIIPFYQKMREYRMILLCHVGDEHAMSAGGTDQELGNPLLLRCPLDNGVKVIAAHCASEGYNIDYDERKILVRETNFRLFMRLFEDKKYKDLLFADISSMLLVTRIGEPLTTILNRTDLHGNLVYGSDYPVPSIGLISRTDKLCSHGYITTEQKKILNEIFDCNPLLFDFVAKRIVRSPDLGNKFSKSIFVKNARLFD